MCIEYNKISKVSRNLKRTTYSENLIMSTLCFLPRITRLHIIQKTDISSRPLWSSPHQRFHMKAYSLDPRPLDEPRFSRGWVTETLRSEIKRCLVLEKHLGHPRVTVARQSDWALFTLPAPLRSILDTQGLQSPASRTGLFILGLILAKSTSLISEVNKPQARIYGVGISIPLQYIQIPASRSLQVRLHLRFGLLPNRV
jgi:hypothetical protein